MVRRTWLVVIDGITSVRNGCDASSPTRRCACAMMATNTRFTSAWRTLPRLKPHINQTLVLNG